jgi:hypothetical protein
MLFSDEFKNQFVEQMNYEMLRPVFRFFAFYKGFGFQVLSFKRHVITGDGHSRAFLGFIVNDGILRFDVFFIRILFC